MSKLHNTLDRARIHHHSYVTIHDTFQISYKTIIIKKNSQSLAYVHAYNNIRRLSCNSFASHKDTTATVCIYNTE